VRVLPVHAGNFQIEKSTSPGFSHREPIGGPYSKPAGDNKYSYPLKGDGTDTSFRFQLDDQPLDDNYGMLRIRVTQARESDCKQADFRAFGGFTKERACKDYVKRTSPGDDDDDD